MAFNVQLKTTVSFSPRKIKKIIGTGGILICPAIQSTIQPEYNTAL